MAVLAFLLLWGAYRGMVAIVKKVQLAWHGAPLEPAKIPAWHPETLP